MQPYFFPAPRYFALVDAADIFVFFDDVQFVTKRWTHRNRLPGPDGEYRFTVPLEGRSQSRSIADIAVHPGEYPRWRRKFLTTLRAFYGGSERLDELADLLAPETQSLADLAMRSVQWASNIMRIRTDFRRSSAMEYARDGDGSTKIRSISRMLGAGTYANAAGGRALYDHQAFQADGVALRFVEPAPDIGDAGDYSILHALLTRSPVEARALCTAYTLEA
ncbi:MAG: WbqC family protein [Erythrobacter sp.]